VREITKRKITIHEENEEDRIGKQRQSLFNSIVIGRLHQLIWTSTSTSTATATSAPLTTYINIYIYIFMPYLSGKQHIFWFEVSVNDAALVV